MDITYSTDNKNPGNNVCPLLSAYQTTDTCNPCPVIWKASDLESY